METATTVTTATTKARLALMLLVAAIATLATVGFANDRALAQEPTEPTEPTIDVLATTYIDANRNGTQDANEPPINVDLELITDFGAPPLTSPGVVQADGSVLFSDVEAGSHLFVLGAAGQAQNLQFVSRSPATAEIFITNDMIEAGETIPAAFGVTGSGVLSIATDDPSVVFSLYSDNGIGPAPIRTLNGTDPIDVPLAEGSRRLRLESSITTVISAVSCDGQEVIRVEDSPEDGWVWNLDINQGQRVECTVFVAEVETARVSFAATGFANVSFASNQQQLGITPGGSNSIELAPGSYDIAADVEGSMSTNTLMSCDGAELVATGDEEWTLTVEAGSTSSCFLSESPRTASFTVVNGNDADMYIPYADQTRPPWYEIYDFRFLWSGELPAVGPPAPWLDQFPPPWQFGTEPYEFEIVLAPLEQLASFDCVGASSQPTITSGLNLGVRTEVVGVSGVAAENEEIECTFTTTQGLFGDVNCDGTRNILDASIIAQHVVGTREEALTCGFEGRNFINLTAADTNGVDGVNILDAVRVAQCVVEVENSLCRAPD